jgi:hypothetical protein
MWSGLELIRSRVPVALAERSRLDPAAFEAAITAFLRCRWTLATYASWYAGRTARFTLAAAQASRHSTGSSGQRRAP